MTRNNTLVTVTGTDVTSGVTSADAEGLFGDLSMDDPGNEYIALKLEGILPASGEYIVTETNPALAYWVGTDENVTSANGKYVKEKTYLGDAANTDLWIVLLEGNTEVTVTVSADDDITYTINSNWTSNTQG